MCASLCSTHAQHVTTAALLRAAWMRQRMYIDVRKPGSACAADLLAQEALFVVWRHCTVIMPEPWATACHSCRHCIGLTARLWYFLSCSTAPGLLKHAALPATDLQKPATAALGPRRGTTDPLDLQPAQRGRCNVLCALGCADVLKAVLTLVHYMCCGFNNHCPGRPICSCASRAHLARLLPDPLCCLIVDDVQSGATNVLMKHCPLALCIGSTCGKSKQTCDSSTCFKAAGVN